jgi:(p)ppGpp synthase/HD superfamily hydrolase
MSHTTQSPALVAKARAFAADKHRGQKGKRPGEAYIDHVETVVRLLNQEGATDPTLLAAAYLHDCLEKTDASIADLVREFGEEVAELVFG